MWSSPELLSVIVPPTPSTARQVLDARPDLEAVIDGPMFGYCEGEPHDYARYRCGAVDYFLHDEDEGVHVEGDADKASRGATFSVVGGAVVVAPGKSPAPGARVAFQLYPALVEDGRIAVGQAAPGRPDAEANHRSAVLVTRDGRVGFAYARTSMRDFAERLSAAGAAWAGYTDGGGSSTLVRRTPSGLEGTDADDPDGRRVPSFIAFRGPSSGLRRAGASSPATSPVALAAGLALLAVAVYLYAKRRSR